MSTGEIEYRRLVGRRPVTTKIKMSEKHTLEVWHVREYVYFAIRDDRTNIIVTEGRQTTEEFRSITHQDSS